MYPGMFNAQAKSLLLKTTDAKVFAMCANYILKTDSSETEKRTIYEITNGKLSADNGNPILEQLLYQLTNTVKNNTPSIHTLLQKNYLPGHVLIISFQRTNRNYPVISSGETPNIQAMNTLHIKSTQELQAALLSQMQYVTKNDKTPYLLMAAAVSDYIPIKTHEGKLKKEELGEQYSLELKRNVDVLSSLPRKGFKMIGFKAEMDEKSSRKCG